MENKKENKKIYLIAIVVIMIIAIIIGVMVYLKTLTPKNVFMEQIGKVIETYTEGQGETKSNYNYTINLAAKIDTDEEEVKGIAQYINDIKLRTNIQTDAEKKKALMGLNIEYQNEELFDGNAFFQNDSNIYLKIKGLSDRFLKLDLKDNGQLGELEGLFQNNLPIFSKDIDYKKIGNIIMNEISEKLDEKYFSKEDTEGMTKNKLEMSVSDLKQILGNICDNLKSNTEYLNCFENKEGQTKALETIKNELNKMTEYDNFKIEIDVYTKGLISKEIKKTEIKVIMSQDEEVSINLNEVDSNTVEFYLNVKMKENNMLATVEALKGTVKFEKENDTEKLAIVVDNIPEVGKITLNMDVILQNSTELENIDVTQSIDMNNMSFQEQAELYGNLSKMKIYQLFIQMMIGQEGVY